MARRLWEALTRQTPTTPTVRDRIADLYGTDPRGRANTRSAADDLGVSQRTVQRWIRTNQQPASPPSQALTRRHTDYQNSPAGRAGQISPRREARLRQQGTTVLFKGKVQISADQRTRSVRVLLTGDQMSAILDAALAGNDRGSLDALEDAFGDVFGGSVALTIDDIRTYR